MYPDDLKRGLKVQFKRGVLKHKHYPVGNLFAK
jgi:hypothetical protein